MTLRAAIVLWLVHWALSVAGYVFVGLWSMGFADSGGVDAPLPMTLASGFVMYVLLQPFAFWLLSFADDWLTGWGSLVALGLICGANSGIVAGLIHGLVGRRARRPKQPN